MQADISVTVTRVDRVDAGRVVALACVELDIDGIQISLQGVRVERSGGSLTCKAPTFRHPATGQWLPAVVLPDAVQQAVAEMVLR